MNLKALKLFSSILFTLLLLSCGSNTDDADPIVEEMEEVVVDEIDVDNNSNPGLIRSISDGFEIFYKYDGDTLIEATGDDGDRNLDITYVYNDDGNIMQRSHEEYNDLGMINYIVYDFEYNTDGQLIRFIDQGSPDSANIIYQNNEVIVEYDGSTFLLILELDEFNRVTRLETSSWYKIFTYDSNGNLVLNEEFDTETNELTKLFQYTYDTNPNPFFNQSQSTYLFEFILYFLSSGWSFDDSIYYDFPYLPNNLTSLTYTDQESTISLTYLYTYNSEGKIITVERNNISNGSTENYTLTYYE